MKKVSLILLSLIATLIIVQYAVYIQYNFREFVSNDLTDSQREYSSYAAIMFIIIVVCYVGMKVKSGR